MNRIPGCIVTAHHGKIQDKDEAFYKQFKVIISGLDNIEARRWLNSLVVGILISRYLSIYIVNDI